MADDRSHESSLTQANTRGKAAGAIETRHTSAAAPGIDTFLGQSQNERLPISNLTSDTTLNGKCIVLSIDLNVDRALECHRPVTSINSAGRGET